MQVWATVVHGSAGLHDVTAAGGVTVVVPPDFVDTSIAWPMPALMEPPVVAAAKKAVAVAECAAEGLEWPCHDVGSTIVANNGGYYYGDITNDGGI